MLPPPFAGELLHRAARHNLVKNCLLVCLLTKQAAEPLHVFTEVLLPDRTMPTFAASVLTSLSSTWLVTTTEYWPLWKRSRTCSLPRFGLVRDGGDEELTGDLIDGGVVGRENDDAVAGVLPQEFLEFQELAAGRAFEPLVFAIGLKGFPTLLRLARFEDETLPAAGAGQRDIAIHDELAVFLAGLVVATLLIGGQLHEDLLRAILRQELAGKLLDLAAIDDRTDQVGIGVLHAVGPFGVAVSPSRNGAKLPIADMA